MKNNALRNIVRFTVLMIAQVLVFNNMNLGSYLNPYVYILFLLLLPANINKSLLLIIAFATGISLDYFGNTLGLHASACVFVAFIRPGTINLFFRNYEFAKGEEPSPFNIGWGGFVRYAIVMVFVHQLVFFYLEALSFSHFFQTLFRVMLSTILTLSIIVIIELIFSKRKRSI
jgi:hypothetical protein